MRDRAAVEGRIVDLITRSSGKGCVLELLSLLVVLVEEGELDRQGALGIFWEVARHEQGDLSHEELIARVHGVFLERRPAANQGAAPAN